MITTLGSICNQKIEYRKSHMSEHRLIQILVMFCNYLHSFVTELCGMAEKKNRILRDLVNGPIETYRGEKTAHLVSKPSQQCRYAVATKAVLGQFQSCNQETIFLPHPQFHNHFV